MLVTGELEFSLGLETHILHLSLILDVLLVDVLNFVLSIVLDLLYDLPVVLLHPLNFSSQLLSLSNLSLHESSVLFHDLSHISVMLVNDIIDSLLKLPSILFLLSLQLLELCSIFKHLLRILVSLLFQLNLELLCQLLNLLFKGILHFSLVFIKRVISVLSLYL
jgi:hypothetical protein